MGVGFQRITSDIVLGTSGEPVVIYGMNIVSGVGGGGVVNLRTGTAVSGAIITQEKGTTGEGRTFSYGKNGVTFPSGCYVDIDTNVSQVTVFYRRVK